MLKYSIVDIIINMPSGKTKFNSSWLEAIDSNEQKLTQWCRIGKDEFHGYCRFCDVDIKCDNSGKNQLLQHAKKEKHKEAIRFVQDKTQPKLHMATATPTSTHGPSVSKELSILKYDDSKIHAQIYWLAKVAICNFSLRSLDHIGDTFKCMFPDSKIAADLSLSRTSASYMITEGMAPHFRQVLVEDLRKSDLPFALHFDETTNVQVKKQMDLTLRYWSPTHEQVWVAFYTSCFFGHADSETVVAKIFEQLKQDNVPVKKLITLVRDGPNVNKAIYSKLEQMIKDETPDFTGFVDLGSCVLHVVHNAFGKGLEKYGQEVQQLCLDVHALFKYSAARREDYQKLQLEMEVGINMLLKHTEVRWLSIGPAITRLLEQWDCLCDFVKQLGKDEKSAPKSSNYRRVRSMLGSETQKVTKVQLEFIKGCVPVFEEFLTLFQKNEPTIHLLYSSMCSTLLKLLLRFIKPEVVDGKHGRDLASISTNSNHQLTDKDLDIGDGTRKALAVLKPDQQRSPLLAMRAFFVSAITHLQSRLPLNNNVLKDLGCFNPLSRNEKTTLISIQNLTRKLQPTLDVSAVTDEWKLLQVDEDISSITETQIELYWQAVFSLKAFSGDQRYSLLPKVIKSGLVLAQTNAESERSLSINARLVTKERASLGEASVIGLRTVKEAVHFYDPVENKPEKISVTKDLIRLVKCSYASYRAKLEEEKKEANKKKMEEEISKKAEEQAKAEREKLSQKRAKMKASESDLRMEEDEILGEVRAADQLLSDASKKLQEAISGSSVDKMNITVATMMLDTAKQKREGAMKKLDEIRKRQKKLEDETDRLFDKAVPSTHTKIDKAVPSAHTKKKCSEGKTAVPKKKPKLSK